ncbi:MAG: polysulfide reductase NrfD [Chloroflexi bacterium]|nr:polysulfide reductase NrfD [Chloroflexota bacterium]
MAKKQEAKAASKGFNWKSLTKAELAVISIGALAFILGVWGLYTRLFVGEREVGYGSYVVWGLWVSMYLFLAGVATGSYMIAVLEYLFNVPMFKGTGKAALWAGLVTMPAALASIGMDLGHMERIINVYLRPNFMSLLAQMVWGYTLFLLVVIVTLWFAFKRPSDTFFKVVLWIGFFMSIFLSGGVGALLGVNASRPYWSVGLLSVQFPIFAFASGVSLMLIVVGWFMHFKDEEQRYHLFRWLGWVAIALSLAKIYILWAYLSQAWYSQVPDVMVPFNEIIFGEYWWSFWIIQIAIGTVIPLVLHMIPKLAHNKFWAGAIGVMVLIGFAAARANIVFPAMSVEMLDGLPNAFFGPHLNIRYFPSSLEWSVTLGVIGAAILAFVLGAEFLAVFNKPKTEVK